MRFKRTTKSNTTWLDAAKYDSYCVAIIGRSPESEDDLLELTSKEVSNLAEKLEYHRSGGKTSQGRQVYIKVLMAVLGTMVTQESFDEVIATMPTPQIKSLDEF